MTTPVVPVLVLVLTLAAACGTNGDRGSRAALTRPTGADEVVVQVMVAGGFLPAELAVAEVPKVTVLGDGTVITPAPVVAIYPGPAITPLQSVRVPDRTVDDLVERAAGLGLLVGPLDFGQPPVADAPDTIVTIEAGGRTVRHRANALGINDGVGPPPRGGTADDPPAPGLDEQAVANRRALRDFVAATEELPPGEEPWEPPAVAVYLMGDDRPDPDVPQPARDWPLDTAPTEGRPFPCMLVEGEELRVLLEALGDANARTPWIVDGRERSMAFRPVVPGQPGCTTR